ncbi:hypothetical protein PHBOTO_006358 [Pseudozyma hubeiensis]|nr:hypothetical protein PHBOTO_006358 [Pseudozyma hubeiensis]
MDPSTAELAFISGVTVIGGPDEPTLLGVHHLQAASNPISPPTDPAFASSIVPTASRALAQAASQTVTSDRSARLPVTHDTRDLGTKITHPAASLDLLEE